MTLRVLNFNPGIRGVRRDFKVRVMPWAGDLWLCALDASRAMDWAPRTLRSRTRTGLATEGRGYATLPMKAGHRMMVMVSRHALSELLSRARTRQGRMFRRWLDELTDVA